jgi:hypothetical protein
MERIAFHGSFIFYLRILQKMMTKIIYFILKLLKWWFWSIPLRFNILATATYFGIFYLVFGTIDVFDASKIMEKNGINDGFIIFFAIPILLSFASFMAPSFGNASSPLSDAIKYRNGQMAINEDKKASEIFQKTAILDAMNNSSNSETMKQAERGFNARFGNDPPSKIFDELTKKP